MRDGPGAVVIPIRIVLDAPVAHAADVTGEAVGAALARAIEASMNAVVRRRSARPAVGAWPAFSWSGSGVATVDLAARARIESAVLGAVRAQVGSWPEQRGVAPFATPHDERSGTTAIPVTIPIHAAEAGRFAAARGGASAIDAWIRWLDIVQTWDTVPAGTERSPARPAAVVTAALVAQREAARIEAFVARLEHGLPFVPDVRRIVAEGFNADASWSTRLGTLVRDLDRGFIAAFANAMRRRDILDWITDVAVEPLAGIVMAFLARDAFSPEPRSARDLVKTLETAFPSTDLSQVCGEPVDADYDRLIALQPGLGAFRDALSARGLDETASGAFTRSFVHALFESLADTYRQLMHAAIEEMAAVHRVFRWNADSAGLPGWQVARLTADFDSAVSSVAGRTPEAAIAGGREIALVSERVHAALRNVSAIGIAWRADIRRIRRTGFPDGFVLALHAPDLDGASIASYASGAGYDALRDLLRGYAALAGEWQASGALGFLWRTGISGLDAILQQIVGEMRAADEPGAAFFLDGADV